MMEDVWMFLIGFYSLIKKLPSSFSKKLILWTFYSFLALPSFYVSEVLGLSLNVSYSALIEYRQLSFLMDECWEDF
jgi:hypothetical protein